MTYRMNGWSGWSPLKQDDDEKKGEDDVKKDEDSKCVINPDGSKTCPYVSDLKPLTPEVIKIIKSKTVTKEDLLKKIKNPQGNKDDK